MIFILHFGINSVFESEWNLIPTLKSYLTGHPWLHYLLVQSEEHRPVFPHLIFLGLAYLTSYNIISEMILGWVFLSITVFILWRILLQTFPEGKWIIIPIAWLAYSFSQYETVLWGLLSIDWYLTILMIVLTIYFLNKIKDSPSLIIPAIISSFVASFSLIVGLFVWVVGFLSFNKRFSLKLLLFYTSSAITCFAIFFNNWTGLTASQAHSSIVNPFEFLAFVLAFLGNAVRIRGAEEYGINANDFSSFLGSAILCIFLIAIFLHRHYNKDSNRNIIPWLQFAILGILFGIIAAFGRLGIYGMDMALSSRYVSLSNFFLIGTLVIVLMVLTNLSRSANLPRNRKIAKIFIIVILVLLSADIVLGNIVGFLGASQFHERIATGTSCLMNYESASNDCLQNLYPDPAFVRENAKTLQDLCIGPFTSYCK